MKSRKKVALVTGGSRGIGLAVARRLVEDGFDLTLSARRVDVLSVVADELRSTGAKVIVAPADMAVEHDAVKLADSHMENFERLDLLVICAGVGRAGDLETFPIHQFDKQLSVNVRSPFLLIQRLLPLLRATAALEEERGSKIVALASIAGVSAEPDLAAYSASKAALISLCESIIMAESKHGVTATSISPGFVATDMSAWVHDRVPADQMIRVSDIAVLVSAISQLSRFAVVPNLEVTRPGERLWRA